MKTLFIMNSVYLNGYSLKILVENEPIKKILYGNSNYFGLPNKSEYKIKLSNDNESKCDVSIWIDDIKIGVWRINSYESIVIERPVNHSRKFTFFKENSLKLKNNGIIPNDPSNGLIKIEFKPEKKPQVFFQNYYYDSSTQGSTQYCNFLSNNSSYLSSGATVLGDTSNQKFNRTKSLNNIDYDKITTIYARLVIDNNKIHKERYIPLNTYYNSTPIPPRIDIQDNFPRDIIYYNY